MRGRPRNTNLLPTGPDPKKDLFLRLEQGLRGQGEDTANTCGPGDTHGQQSVAPTVPVWVKGAGAGREGEVGWGGPGCSGGWCGTPLVPPSSPFPSSSWEAMLCVFILAGFYVSD